jgi:diguanylate cyclase (GGDEF)-like protein
MLAPGDNLGQGLALLIAIGAMSFVGCASALRLVATARSAQAAVAKHVGMAGMVLATTAWATFLLALRIRFPHLDPEIPWPALLQSSATVAGGMVLALLIVTFGRHSARNVAFAGSIISSSISCMVFASMSGLAAPSALAYDLTRVVIAMAGSSTLSAGSLWLSARPQRGQILAASLMAAALTLLALLSLSSILPFSEWQIAAATPGAIAFRPVTVVFLSELGVTLLLVVAGEGVDRQAAARIASENDRLRQLTEGTFEALLIHRDGIVLDANSTGCELIGQPLSMIKGQPLQRFLPQGDSAPGVSPLTGKAAAEEAEVTGAGGVAIPVEVLSRDIHYAGGTARITALRDMRERRAAEARIRFLAQHDPLTGLPNRASFHDAIARQLALSRRDGASLAVFCIDLDRFKAVNDTLGHKAGDLLLQQVAERIRADIREIDTVARIGGDEFVLLQAGAAQPESSARLAARLIGDLSDAFELDGHRITVGASTGRRHRSLPRQGKRPRQLLLFQAWNGYFAARATGNGAGPRRRAGDALLPACVPAAVLRPVRKRDDRLRGAAALAACASRPGPTYAVHRYRRGDEADRAHRSMGVGECVP